MGYEAQTRFHARLITSNRLAKTAFERQAFVDLQVTVENWEAE